MQHWQLQHMPLWQREGVPHLWMPYAQMQTTPEPLAVVGAEGCRIHLADGRELIDGISSWWSVCHGYQHPALVQAVQEQAATLSHVMFAGMNHEPALKLGVELSALLPQGLPRIFFSDSGSVAVEVAMKMAVQYWRNLGQKKRNKFVCFHHGYHGDTMGAMSLSDPERGMHAAFNHYMPQQYSVPIPADEYGFAEFDELLGGLNTTIAGVIIEPLVQGAGGMKFHSADILAEIHRMTKAHGLLFIADEIATGFGRTGYMFACEEAGISPDILCVGKALTGGMLTLAATAATEEIFHAFLDDDLYKAFMHGPTYMANPLACAAARASLQLFRHEPRLEQIAAIEQHLREMLAPARRIPHVRDVRVKGAMGVIEYNPAMVDMWQLRMDAAAEGIWIRPFGDVLYLTPPYVISVEELQRLCDVSIAVLKKQLAL